jgi:hypothetical protein
MPIARVIVYYFGVSSSHQVTLFAGLFQFTESLFLFGLENSGVGRFLQEASARAADRDVDEEADEDVEKEAEAKKKQAKTRQRDHLRSVALQMCARSSLLV